MDDPNLIDMPVAAQSSRPRPALFLALGHREPAEEIEVDDVPFQRVRTFKHDSWAATALYEHDSKRIVVKFNREQPIFGFPMKWVGRALARREAGMLQRLASVQNVPAACPHVKVDGHIVPTASGHEFVEGRSLLGTDKVDDAFFARLSALVGQLHALDVAYVDLHKLDNILVDERGVPHLIDFQISVHLPRWWPASYLLSVLQHCDLYHLQKHELRSRPHKVEDLIDPPRWIKAHRAVAIPFRKFRRWLLVRLGIRRGYGMASSEHAPQEDVLDAAARASANLETAGLPA